MPKKPGSFLEIGRSGSNRSAGRIYDEFLTTLRGSTGIKKYHEMRENDPIIGACMHAITQILRESRWSVQEAEGGSAEDAKFLEDNMTSMVHSWGDFFTDILSFLTYGFSLFEQVYHRRPDGKIGWKKFAFRAQQSFEKWEIDTYGDTLGFWQRPAPDYTLFYIPIKKCLHFRTEPHGANPEGRSVLRNAFRPWFFKKAIEEIEGIGIERDLAGMPVLKLPEGMDPNSEDDEVVAQIAAAKTLVTNIRRDEQDGVLELLASSGARQIDTVAVINRYNKEIAVTVLAQFVMLGMERTGSYALAREQTEMFYQCLDGWADTIATSINRQAVVPLFKYNGVIDKPLPQVVHTPVRRFALKDLASFVSTLANEQVGALDIDVGVRRYLKKYGRLEEFSEVRK